MTDAQYREIERICHTEAARLKCPEHIRDEGAQKVALDHWQWRQSAEVQQFYPEVYHKRVRQQFRSHVQAWRDLHATRYEDTSLTEPVRKGESSEDDTFTVPLIDQRSYALAVAASDPDHEDMLDRLRTLLDQLPPKQQICVRERYYGEKMPKQIAAELGCTETSVRQCITLGLRRLKELASQ